MARRQKEEDHVMMENLGLYRKLQAVRPTSDVDRRKHADDFKASRRNLEKLRTRREDPRPAPPGAGQDKVWNDRWQCQENV